MGRNDAERRSFGQFEATTLQLQVASGKTEKMTNSADNELPCVFERFRIWKSKAHSRPQSGFQCRRKLEQRTHWYAQTHKRQKEFHENPLYVWRIRY